MPAARRIRGKRQPYRWTLGDRLLVVFGLTVCGPLAILAGVTAHLVWRWLEFGWGWG